MRVLLWVHHGLQEVGKGLGILFRLALALALFFGSVVAVLMASFFAAFEVAHVTGGGELVGFALIWVFVGLIGFYAAPHAQPQISRAMMALLDTSDV